MGSRLSAGIVGGIAAGLVFGAWLHGFGMMASIGGLVGDENAQTGWIVHLVLSAAIGAGYALVFGALRPSSAASAGYGLLYGAVWWVLGPLLLMPLLTGMEAFPPIARDRVLSLVGHLAYGLVLGITYVAVRDRAPRTSGSAVRQREIDARS